MTAVRPKNCPRVLKQTSYESLKISRSSVPPTSAENGRGFPAGTALTGLIPRRRPIARCMPLGRLISGEPAHHGVAEVIWSALHGVVRVQIIVNAPIE